MGGGGDVESQKQFPGNFGRGGRDGEREAAREARQGGSEGGPREEDEELGLEKQGLGCGACS